MLTLLRRFSLFTPALLLAGCQMAPDFPDTPVISTNKIEVSRKVEVGGSTVIKVLFTINWTDGDGDLGRIDTLHKDYNYYLKLFKKKNGNFIEVTPITANAYNGTFPNLSPDGSTKKMKLRGTLSFSVNDPGFTIPGDLGKINGNLERNRAGDVLRFEVYIVDRAGNKSNIVTSPEVTL